MDLAISDTNFYKEIFKQKYNYTYHEIEVNTM